MILKYDSNTKFYNLVSLLQIYKYILVYHTKIGLVGNYDILIYAWLSYIFVWFEHISFIFTYICTKGLNTYDSNTKFYNLVSLLQIYKYILVYHTKIGLVGNYDILIYAWLSYIFVWFEHISFIFTYICTKGLNTYDSNTKFYNLVSLLQIYKYILVYHTKIGLVGNYDILIYAWLSYIFVWFEHISFIFTYICTKGLNTYDSNTKFYNLVSLLQIYKYILVYHTKIGLVGNYDILIYAWLSYIFVWFEHISCIFTYICTQVLTTYEVLP